MTTAPYPLLFETKFYEKVWGGRALERLGKTLPAGKSIGESWELADMPATSASGAGGGAARSVIANGFMNGRTLGEACTAWGTGMLGPSRLSEDGGFPLLVKFLDARENLSVQVHPSPAYARTHREAKLKTECWYILDATPGAVIYKGIKPGVTRASFAAHIADGSVAGDMIAVPAVPGECHNLPSGTCHALGAGVLVAEVQTPSDTTFRVFDWGRSGRELHVAPALECIDFGPAPAGARLSSGAASGRLVTTEFFTLDEHLIDAGAERVIGGDRAAAVIVLDGTLSLRSRRGVFGPTAVGRGRTCLVPAGIACETVMTPHHGGACRCLVATVL